MSNRPKSKSPQERMPCDWLDSVSGLLFGHLRQLGLVTERGTTKRNSTDLAVLKLDTKSS
jgi:hypothetical protein